MKTMHRSRRSNKTQTPPVLRAALTFLAPIMALRFISTILLPGIWWLLVLCLLYLLSGYTAGRLYAASIFHARVRQADSQSMQQGAGAGILLFMLGWVGYAILMVLVRTIMPFPLAAGTEYLLVCSGFIEFLAALLLGATGARLYK